MGIHLTQVNAPAQGTVGQTIILGRLPARGALLGRLSQVDTPLTPVYPDCDLRLSGRLATYVEQPGRPELHVGCVGPQAAARGRRWPT